MKAKPFIKWAGGKGQLVEQLEKLMPSDFMSWEDATYIEPFIGGGAMLFHMLQQYPNIKRAVINDINEDLITCYRTIRGNVGELIDELYKMQSQYYSLPDMEARCEMFMNIRQRYNEKNLNPIANTAMFIFLNRTCFNGLYRVNKKGLFNVPFGKSPHPTICNEELLRTDSELLQRVEILCGDFEQTIDYAGNANTIFYLDPPYRPLSETSSFNDYTKDGFNDQSQIRLKEFCDRISRKGLDFMLSNSDSKTKKGDEGFFDVLYAEYHIDRVMASRNINSNASRRGKIPEILVHNYGISKTENDLEKNADLFQYA